MSSTTNSLPDSIDVRARNKSSEIPEQELQREILAQLYIQNHFQTHQFKALESIKGILTFFMVLSLLSILIVVLMLEK
jgi:hypothetical protein